MCCQKQEYRAIDELLGYLCVKVPAWYRYTNNDTSDLYEVFYKDNRILVCTKEFLDDCQGYGILKELVVWGLLYNVDRIDRAQRPLAIGISRGGTDHSYKIDLIEGRFIQ